MLISVTNEDGLQELPVAEKSILQLSIMPLHDTPCFVQDEAYSVTFKNRYGSQYSNFNIIPASKAELTQLALFLGTCTYFHTPVTHQIVPGQYITSTPTSVGNVQITLSTDADLVELLNDQSIISELSLNLSVEQLEAYEEFITTSFTINEAIHSFNISDLAEVKQLQLAS